MPYTGYAEAIKKKRRRARARRRDRRRTRALALRALARNGGDRKAAIAELIGRMRDQRIELISSIRHCQAERMLKAGLTPDHNPRKERRQPSPKAGTSPSSA